jgi:integrase
VEYNITYRKKDGGWQYIISYKEDGKWKQRAKQGFGTRGLAKAAADKRIEKMRKDLKNKQKLNKEYEGITYIEFFNMMIEHEKLYKEQNTIIRYKSANTHFDDIYKLPMDKITVIHIQGCVDKMILKGLAHSTIDAYVSTIKTFFNNAIEPYKIITENPVNDIKLPKIKKEKKVIKALSKPELDKLLKELDGYISEPEYIAVLLAATCGLRVGEILGLTWDNIDFKNSTLKVEKQWKRLKENNGTKMGFGTLKSDESYRTVPVPPSTLLRLRKYKSGYPTDLNNRLIIYKNAASLSRDLPRKIDMVGCEITMHTLRHTYATLLIANGTDFKTAAKLLGHDVEMTIKTYSHVTDDMLKRVSKAVNIIFK